MSIKTGLNVSKTLINVPRIPLTGAFYDKKQFFIKKEKENH
jgi:hypothetical protein